MGSSEKTKGKKISGRQNQRQQALHTETFSVHKKIYQYIISVLMTFISNDYFVPSNHQCQDSYYLNFSSKNSSNYCLHFSWGYRIWWTTSDLFQPASSGMRIRAHLRTSKTSIHQPWCLQWLLHWLIAESGSNLQRSRTLPVFEDLKIYFIDSLEKTLMLGKSEDRRRMGWQRGWDSWMASSTQWT